MLRLVSLGLLLVAGAAAAQDADPSDGQELFRLHCAQCHGADATGGGPMAEMLAVATPDLTVLAANNGGGFPTAEVARQIDGRDRMLAHGGDMPIFGPYLEADQNIPLRLPSGQTMLTGLPLANIIVYLESIQSE